MIHSDHINNYPGSMEALAEEIGNLKYDALSRFLDLLADKIERDGYQDKKRNRPKLAAHLNDCAESLRVGRASIDQAWVICEPYT